MTGLAPGSYVIEVSHPTFVFPPFRVDISSKSGKYLQLSDTPGRLLEKEQTRLQCRKVLVPGIGGNNRSRVMS